MDQVSPMLLGMKRLEWAYQNTNYTGANHFEKTDVLPILFSAHFHESCPQIWIP